jgi:hypothetical protein
VLGFSLSPGSLSRPPPPQLLCQKDGLATSWLSGDGVIVMQRLAVAAQALIVMPLSSVSA